MYVCVCVCMRASTSVYIWQAGMWVVILLITACNCLIPYRSRIHMPSLVCTGSLTCIRIPISASFRLRATYHSVLIRLPSLCAASAFETFVEQPGLWQLCGLHTCTHVASDYHGNNHSVVNCGNSPTSLDSRGCYTSPLFP